MTTERERFVVIPIEQVDVFAAIQLKIVDMIDNGGYEAGDKLPAERDLAGQLNVSRAAVREALKVLQAMGRVRIVHGSGTYVESAAADPISDLLRPAEGFTASYLQHLTEVRAALEVRVAELAARSATPTGIRDTEKVLAELGKQQQDDPELGSLSVSFEAALSAMAGNPLLTALQKSVNMLWVEAWGSLHVAPGPRSSLHAEHLRIFEAIRTNDPELAAALMRKHVDREVGDFEIRGRLSGDVSP
jgi:GntR family transcriptional regulator, transcriptional repressor for pyruvate dehydrogenase complex